MARISGVLCSIAVVACCAPVHAATISFSDTFGPTAIAVPTITVPLSKFDPALGSLTKVTLTLDADTSAGSIAWDNEAGISTDLTLGIGASVTAAVPASPAVLTVVAVPLQLGSATGLDADNDGAADFIGTDAFAVTGGVGMDSDMGMTTAALDLAFFTETVSGSGETFDTDVDSVVETFVSTTGGFGPIDAVPGVTSGTVTVTYEYTVIPEPATGALACVGLLAASLWLRRRR